MFPSAGTLDQKYFSGGGAIFSVSQTVNSKSPLWPGLEGGGGGGAGAGFTLTGA